MKNILSSIASITTMLMLSAYATSAYAQTKTVSGTVFAEGKPVSGVVISQEGSNQTTITTNKGTYQIMVTGNAPVLIFRHPKYADYRLATTGAEHNIQLQPKENTIDEVVINAGYYKVKDRERTGSIAKVTSKDIENQPVTNVLSAVQGRVAGVNITQNSGVAGGGFDVQIRGKNSIRKEGNEPLYIIDGVPIGGATNSPFSGTILPEASINPLNAINANDIESIEILKDADATAIYGSRGANGVILVTTRKAKKGKLTFTLNTSYAISQALSNLKLLNTEEYLNVRSQAFANDGITNYPATAYDVNGKWDKNRYTNWKKSLIGNTSDLSSTQLSLSTGNEATSFLLSYNHQEQTTVFGHGFRYKVNTISSNISHRSQDKRLSINFSNVFSFLTNNVINQDITRNAYLLSPNAPSLYDNNGNLNWENNTFSNPIAAYNSTYSNNTLQFFNNLALEYEVYKNLKLKLNSGLNFQNFEEWSLVPHTIYNPSLGLTSAYSQAYNYNRSKLSLLLEPQLNYAIKKDKHKLDFLLGSTYQSDELSQQSLQGYGFQSNLFIQNIAAAQTKTISDKINSEYKYLAFFGRLNYQYDNKYVLNITARRDGSSRFGPNNKFANFGAIGAAWLFSEESFLKGVKWLSLGKLRASLGTTGSDNIGDYQYMNTYFTSSLAYNSTVGLSQTKLYNPNFSWEKTTKLETALEMSFLNNRLNFSAAWYKNRSSNQLVGYQLPSITGFTSVLANLDATIQNAGVEFEIAGKIFKPTTKDLSWDTTFNISFPTNKLLSFPDLEGSTYANSYVIGQPINIVKLYHLEGINPQTGLYQFTDYNGDSKITSPDDKQIVKSLSPKFFGGFGNSIGYKNWNLSILLQFVKQENRNYNAVMPSPGSMNNLPKEALNVWSQDNPSGYYMPYHSTTTASHLLFQSSDATVSDASFIRLKNVQITYRIPVKSNIIKDSKVFFQGQNLYTWTNYFGVDPEFSSLGFLPPLKTYSFGMQLIF